MSGRRCPDCKKNTEQKNLAIIGVHNPGSDQADIEKDIKQYELNYPILIDAPRPEESQSWGLLFHQLGGRGIPHVVVVDAEGKIAAQGRLDKVLEKAFALSRETKQ
jgi:hypothetical protein